MMMPYILEVIWVIWIWLRLVEAKLPLFDHDSRLDLSCSEEDYLEALASYSDTRDIELSLQIH